MTALTKISTTAASTNSVSAPMDSIAFKVCRSRTHRTIATVGTAAPRACSRDKFERLTDEAKVPHGSYELIEGFYEKSLTPELRDSLNKHGPSLVTMDSDFYTSTKTVLDWIRPMLVDGTFFMFDTFGRRREYTRAESARDAAARSRIEGRARKAVSRFTSYSM